MKEPAYYGCEREELSDLLVMLGHGPITSHSELISLQDWDLVLSSSAKMLEYVEIYRTKDLCKCQRFEMGALLFASLDDAVDERGADNCTEEIQALISIVNDDYELHEYHVHYWALASTTGEGWSITPIAQEMLRSFGTSGE